MTKPISKASATELLKIGRKNASAETPHLSITLRSPVEFEAEPEELDAAAKHAREGMMYVYMHCGIPRQQLKESGILLRSKAYEGDEMVMYVDHLDLAAVEKLAETTWEAVQPLKTTPSVTVKG